MNKILFGFVLFTNLIFINNTYALERNSHNLNEDNANNNKTKQIIGMVEPVFIYPGNLKLSARIDTGANKTSLDAEDLQIINEDGVKWAYFSVNKVPMKHKIVKFVRIKQHGSASQRRPVIKLKVTLANVTQVVKVTLTDRSNFKYKMLVGVNFLYDNFIVDVSQKNMTKPLKVSVP